MSISMRNIYAEIHCAYGDVSVEGYNIVIKVSYKDNGFANNVLQRIICRDEAVRCTA